MTSLYAKILLTGMELWTEERRTRFKDKYFKIIKKMEAAVNATDGSYNDLRIYWASKEKKLFLEAYHTEVTQQAQEQAA